MSEPTYRIKTHHDGTASLYRTIKVKAGWWWRQDWEFVSGHANQKRAAEAMHQMVAAKAVLDVQDYQANGLPFFYGW